MTEIYNGWSESQYLKLNKEQHKANNDWFVNNMKKSKRGVCVPELGMCWDKRMNKTKIEKYDYIFAALVSRFTPLEDK
jgi:hypothetical protein